MIEIIDPFYLKLLPNLAEGEWQVCDPHGAYNTVNFHKAIDTTELEANKCSARIGLVRYPQHCKYFVEVRRSTSQVATKTIAQGDYKNYPDLDKLAIEAVAELLSQVMTEHQAWLAGLDAEYISRETIEGES